MQKLEKKVEDFLQDGSGWVYDETAEIELRVFKYKPPRGGKYIHLEEWVVHKKAVVNIQNDDDKCFLYCVQAAKMYADGRVKINLERPKQYRDYFHELDYAGIPMPMSLEDIRKFEIRNNVAINVYRLNEKKDKVIPLQCTKVPKEKVPTSKIIKLLLIEENGNSHYTWIKNLDRLLHPKGFCRSFI